MGSLLLTLALTAFSAHSGTALAYLTPEEVLLQSQSTYYAPPNSRHAQEVVDQQDAARLAAKSSAAALSSLSVPDASSSLEALPSADTSHPSAPDGSSSEPSAAIPGLDPVTIRLLDRLQRADRRSNPTDASAGAGTLHGDGGSPPAESTLAGSGPGATVAILAVLGAVVATLLAARRRGGDIRG